MSDYKYQKPSLLHLEGDPNQTAPGFNFTRNDFEDLIDNFTDEETILVLLQVDRPQLDEFCRYIYNMNFKETYDVLYQRAQLYFRKAMMMLSKSGNPSAIKVAAEFYAKLGAGNNKEDKITFVGIMPMAESDVEQLLDKKKEDKAAFDKFVKEEGNES